MGFMVSARATERGIAERAQLRLAAPKIDWEAIARGKAARDAALARTGDQILAEAKAEKAKARARKIRALHADIMARPGISYRLIDEIEERRAAACTRFHDHRVLHILQERIRARILREIYGDDRPPMRQTMRRIIQRICKATGTSEALVRGAGRSRDLVLVRQACMYWCRRLTARSFPVIGQQFSERDHSTAMHNIRAYPERRKKQGRHLRQIMPPVGSDPAVKPLNGEAKP